MANWKIQCRSGVYYARLQETRNGITSNECRSLHTRNRREAETRIREMNQDRKSNTPRTASPTVKNLLPEWCKWSKMHHAPRWHQDILYKIEKYFDPLLPLKVNHIDRRTIQAFQEHCLKQGVKTATVNRVCRSVLGSFLTWCLESGYMDYALRIPALPEHREDRTVYTQAQTDAILEAAARVGREAETLVRLCLFSELRKAEALSLRCQDVNLVNKCIVIQPHKDDGFVPKGKQSRTIPIDHRLIPYLGPTNSNRFFPAPDRPYRRDTRLWTDPMQVILGFHLSLHALRHTFCTRAAKLHPTSVVQKAAGHSSVKTTELYVHLSDGDDLRDLLESI